jgi:hypothetical protein
VALKVSPSGKQMKAQRIGESQRSLTSEKEIQINLLNDIIEKSETSM